MGISVADNFKHLSKKFLDDRESFDTLADMKAVSDSDIPEGFETYCKATDKRYKFLSTNAVDSTTGKWREVEYGGGGVTNYNDLDNRPQIEGVTLTGNKTASDLGLAKANQIPTVPTKVSQLQNDSGFITNSALPGVYEGSTAGLVPAAGSDNEGKYLDNDGNWTDPLEDFVQNSGGKVLLDIPANTYSTYTEAFNVVYSLISSLTREQKSSIKIWVGSIVYDLSLDMTSSTNFYSLFASKYSSDGNSCIRNVKLENNAGVVGGTWYFLQADNRTTYTAFSLSSGAQDSNIKVIDTSVSATMIGKINRSDIYDTTEKVVGKWTDGRPLYQVCIETTMPTVTTDGTHASTTIPFDSTKIIQSIESIIHASSSSSLNTRYLPSFSHSTDNYVATGNIYRNSSGELKLQSKAAADSGKPVTLIIKYTKTTDAANSYNYADENDYSTSEKIIGKWIDGKTLYQKTIDVGALPAATSKKVSHNISGLSKVVSISGVATNGIAALTLPDVDPSNISNATRVLVSSSGEIQLINQVDRSSFNGYVTLKYTKS